MVVHRAIALPKGKNKPDLQYKRTGENVYEIPETEKYVGSYDTAVRVLEHDVYPDGQLRICS